jgi:SAM-dependent methyltransferase
MLEKVSTIVKSRGVSGLSQVVLNRLIPQGQLNCFSEVEQLFSEKVALEIGGPSSVFKRGGLFPIYPMFRRLDNCNFGATTVWEGDIAQGATFQYDRKRAPGHQYVMEGSDLSSIQSGTYDCFLSSHALEHIANPIRALYEWIRVIKDNGILVLVLPHKVGTFDHRRPVTSLEHLISDFNTNISEHDLTHLPEILDLHDLTMDLEAGDIDAFRARSEKNYENRCLHHHVFDARLVVEMLDYVGMRIHAVECKKPYHIFIVAEKIESSVPPDNFMFLRNDTQCKTIDSFIGAT